MKKYRIGYTSGVYDMFHVGHLNLLRNAKSYCDRLVVGVSTDELVKSYKNKIPVISHKDRMDIVSAIRYVDSVVPQVDMDKLASVRSVHADVVFVGSDWKGTSKWNEIEELLKTNGIDVIYLPYTNGISSTILTDIKENCVEE